MKHTALLVLPILLLSLAPSIAQDANNDKIQAAEKASDLWLKSIDSGAYDECYKASAAIVRSSLNSKAWQNSIYSVRGALGKMEKRTIMTRQFLTQLPDYTVPGEYVILQYSTRFANAEKKIETVTLMKDPDGQWRVAGYFIK